MALKTVLNPTVLRQVQHFAENVQKANIPIEKIFVFGSQAKQTPREYSDIDTCVVSKQFGKDRHDERVKLMYLKDKKSSDVEPHPYHPDDLQSKWDSLAAEIRKHGIEVRLK